MTTRILLRGGGVYSTARFSLFFRKTTTTARNLRPNHHLCRRCVYSSSSTSSPSSKDDENINEKQKKPKLLSFHPLSFSGAKLCANMSMLSYWNCGQKGFLDAKKSMKLLKVIRRISWKLKASLDSNSSSRTNRKC